MKAEYLEERLRRLPMLRAVVPFAAGIWAAGRWELPPWLTLCGVVLCGTMALARHSQLYTAAMLLLFGFGTARLHGNTASAPHMLHTEFDLLLLAPPAPREGYTSSNAQIRAWRDPATGRWHETSDKVVVWADTELHVNAAERIVCSGRIRPFPTRPENYRSLMLRRGYAGTISLSRKQLLFRRTYRTATLHRWAVERLDRLRLAPDAQALCNAMTAGDRSRLTPELREVYARSGTSHLLAVSGLHVGIVFVLVNLLLRGLSLLWPRRGHIVRNLAAIVLIWLYAAVAGFSPSVVRAAAMFSALQFSLASASVYTGMNILAATAFGMLLFRPAWLHDISFRLSFLAVAAIFSWGVPLCRRLRTRRLWIDLPAAALIVSAVSTLATAPLVSHTFGIVSAAGLIVNPVAIVLAHVIVSAALIWIVLPLAPLAPAFETVIGSASHLLNGLAATASAVPWGAFEVWLTSSQAAAWYAFFLVATLAAACRNPKKAISLPP